MLTNIWRLSGVLFLLFLLVGCGNQAHEKEAQKNTADLAAMESVPAEAPGGFSEGETSQSKQESSYQRKIIKSAEIHQKVTELEPALKQVQEFVDRSGGYVQSSSIQKYRENEREAVFILRIPQQNYLSIVNQIQSIGKTTRISQKGEDVTDQFYDNEARIRNLSLQEEAVQKLLAQANKMEDILKIQQELFRIRGEIEGLEGKNRYLDHLSNLSTINLTILEVQALEYAEDKPWAQARTGFVQSLGGVGEFFIQIMVLLITYLPFLLFVYLPLGLFVWWMIRRQKRKKSDIDNNHS
ncbi:DUF4349 domain-containing protein [Ammoniphilus sp. 3BR4]|uniref:DUF4349 domain-containing protein n=1 Tax=Ammoniphilus sp. 3BR4 TaxID=3158265 RepID=UPI0034672AF0